MFSRNTPLNMDLMYRTGLRSEASYWEEGMRTESFAGSSRYIFQSCKNQKSDNEKPWNSSKVL